MANQQTKTYTWGPHLRASQDYQTADRDHVVTTPNQIKTFMKTKTNHSRNRGPRVMQAKLMTMSCLKLCSRYQAIKSSAADFSGADDSSPLPRRRAVATGDSLSAAPPERASSLSERASSLSESREIDEVVQQICDITRADDDEDDVNNDVNDDDKDHLNDDDNDDNNQQHGGVYAYCPNCQLKAWVWGTSLHNENTKYELS